MKSSQRRDLRPEGRMGVTRLDGPRKERGEGKTGRGKNMAALGGERRWHIHGTGKGPQSCWHSPIHIRAEEPPVKEISSLSCRGLEL